MSGPSIDVHAGDWPLEAAIVVRTQVFVEEQDIPESLELDGRDSDAVHAIARVGDAPVGTGRLRRVDDATGKIERVAVLPGYRGEGVGRNVVYALEFVADERDFERTVLHARVDVEEFYHALGYETTSDVFEEAGSPHVAMEKRLGGEGSDRV